MRCHALALVVLAACGGSDFGNGIGRPTYPPSGPRPDRALTIAEVYFAVARADRFAVITNDGDVAATDLRLVGRRGEVAVAAPVPARGELRVSIAGLVPNETGGDPTSGLAFRAAGLFGGELALVDGGGTVQDYLAWGSDPGLAGSTLLSRAIESGVAVPGDFVPAGLMVPDGMAIVRLAGGSGCAPAAATVAELEPPSPCPVPAGGLALREVRTAGANGADTWVELEGTLAGVVDLFGVRICYSGGCLGLEDPGQLNPGERVAVHFGAATEKPWEIAFPGVRPLPAAGEVFVLAPGGATPDLGREMRSYVRYGSAQHPAPQVGLAVAQGLWPSADALVPLPRHPGDGLAYVDEATFAPTFFVPAMPTPGSAPPAIGPATDIWTSCSSVRGWRPTSRPTLAIRGIDTVDQPGTPGTSTVRLVARGSAPEPLAGIELVVVAGGATQVLDLSASGAIAAGAELVVALGASAGCTNEVCWPGASLAASGEVLLRRGTGLVHYVAYGSASRSFAAAAIEVNIWPGWGAMVDCAVDLGADGAAELDVDASDVTRDGTSPPDWR